jgi:DNA-binding NtrC family response regulator
MNLQSVKQRFGIIGRSEKLDRALSTAVRVAPTDLTVLIQGQSGVGKEVFSRIIHNLSVRKHNNFIAINCGAIPAGTINSELFGHEKGAFTGATADRKGYFETVNGGTIFLDEIGEMPLDTQSYLLRILENGEFLKVGSSKVLKTDVRVIAATNVDLLEKIKAGKFREDLYYRLNTVPIHVPALQERREDIFLLWRKFAGDFAEKYRSESIRLDETARLLIENYSWPGNIRELKNMVEQLSVLSEDKHITAHDLLEQVPHIRQRNLPSRSFSGEEGGDHSSSFQEREILYKFLLEMKGDLNDLKSLVYEMIRNNDLQVPNIGQFQSVSASISPAQADAREIFQPDASSRMYEDYETSIGDHKPIIIDRDKRTHYEESEVVEENLSLEEMENRMIKKALKKYKGRRKDAAEELGISERTLYRKIKQYEIVE